MDYEVRSNFFGGATVGYKCAGCGHELESPLDEAGQEHPCPFCGHTITTPGLRELEKDRERAELEKQEQARRRAEAAEQQAAFEAAKAVAEANNPRPPSELVWYGEMYCNACGYAWKSRRNTPPARCHNCSSRNITAVQRQKAGCLGAVLWFAAGAALLVSLMASH